MFVSQKGLFRTVGFAIVAALCAVLLLGVVACGGGDDKATTTVEVTTTEAAQTVTTAAVTETSGVATIDEALVGKWVIEATGQAIEFTADGRMIVTAEGQEGAMEFTYTADGTNVNVSDGTTEFPAPYSIEGDTLTMVDPETGTPEKYARVAS